MKPDNLGRADWAKQSEPPRTTEIAVHQLIRTSLYTFLVLGLMLTASLATQDDQIPADTENKTTASGLQYCVLKASEGPVDHPKMHDKVRVHYTGWFKDGTVFDSSRSKGEPIEFTLGEVIEGWNEGLQLMSPGDRFKFTIPYKMAYGEKGRPGIPPKSDLIFDVELLAISLRAPEPPVFHKLDAEKTKTTKSGFKYEVVKPGEGAMAMAGDGVVMQYSFWNTEGKLSESSKMTGTPLSMLCSSMPLPFLKEVAAKMPKGAIWRCEVPAKLAFGEAGSNPLAGKVTIWELEMSGIYKAPPFVEPDAAKLTETASGLKYEVVKEGTGGTPKMYEYVTCNYAGWLTDGTYFDGSYTRGEPTSFLLGRVIAGWNEGLQLMKEGAIYRFVIPGDLAYGAQGRPPTIQPNATLIFQVELVKLGK